MYNYFVLFSLSLLIFSTIYFAKLSVMFLIIIVRMYRQFICVLEFLTVCNTLLEGCLSEVTCL